MPLATGPEPPEGAGLTEGTGRTEAGGGLQKFSVKHCPESKTAAPREDLMGTGQGPSRRRQLLGTRRSGHR